MSWAEIKYALNSTLGTSSFKSLDKIITDLIGITNNTGGSATAGTVMAKLNTIINSANVSHGSKIFLSSGSWTAPTGVCMAYVEIVGSGGGGYGDTSQNSTAYSGKKGGVTSFGSLLRVDGSEGGGPDAKNSPDGGQLNAADSCVILSGLTEPYRNNTNYSDYPVDKNDRRIPLWPTRNGNYGCGGAFGGGALYRRGVPGTCCTAIVPVNPGTSYTITCGVGGAAGSGNSQGTYGAGGSGYVVVTW